MVKKVGGKIELKMMNEADEMGTMFEKVGEWRWPLPLRI
jgi:hypothetical protein